MPQDKTTSDKPVSAERLDREIMRIYQRNIGEVDKQTFESRVLPLARAELAQSPTQYCAVLKQLIVAASHLREPELKDLWDRGVSSLTFKFHRPDSHRIYGRRIIPELFHINDATVLSPLSKLTPPHILREQPFDRAEYANDPDRFSVCFVKGAILRLSKFLVGHQLVDSHSGLSCELFKAEGLTFF